MAKICEFSRRCSLSPCRHKMRHDSCMFKYHNCDINGGLYTPGTPSKHNCKCIDVTYII